jgi:GMP synthase (glutamine-hydrolysing)
MRVLSLIHGRNAHSGVFGGVVRAAGHELDERSFALADPPVDPPQAYQAVMVFGGSMNVHEVHGHPWLRDERDVLERALEDDVPVLGVCLGAQLLASVAGAAVSRAPEPEIGWYEVEKTPEAADDPLLAELPQRFTAYQWHSYRFDVPRDAVVLATSPVCAQAYRLGEAAWGTQFHAEVTREIVLTWIENYGTDPDAVRVGFDQEAERRRLDAEIARWNELGRTLAGRFLELAEERAGVGAERASA